MPRSSRLRSAALVQLDHIAIRIAQEDPLCPRPEAHGTATQRHATTAASQKAVSVRPIASSFASVFTRGPQPNRRKQIGKQSVGPSPAHWRLYLWAQHPGASLDPVIYALVDPDESVRVRAQEVLEQELARR